MNNRKPELRDCKICNEEVLHFGVIVKPKYEAPKGRKEKFKVFISAFIAGRAAGACAGFMELRDLHLICKKCGNKIIESYRGDLDY